MQGQTGTYTITTLLTPPFTHDLTTLAAVKDELSIDADKTESDVMLRRYITQESANISGWCKRVFGLATWQDVIRLQQGVWGEGVRAPYNPLVLSKYPLTAVVVTLTGNTHGTNVIDGLSTTTGLYAGQLIFGPGLPVGVTIRSVNTSAGSLQLTQAATAATAATMLVTGLQVIETVGGTSTTLVAGTDYEVQAGTQLPGDEVPGALYRLNTQGQPRTWPAGHITVVYQAGYALPRSPLQYQVPVMPGDLEGVVIDNVVGRFRARGRDPFLRAQDQPQLGRQEWWIGAMPGQSEPYPNEIMAVLDRYRSPTTGAA